ncbi:tyrosine-type recombinase/integrase [Oceanisphaera sp. KMM 10153]|uniref:tyrosine-type recombinase/integrase n=1 Tax=Oceanisphaera submarina TaxID=3390193 RepID=UPI003975449B
MKLPTKVQRLLDATPGVHIHKGRLRLAFKVPGRRTPLRKSIGLLPTETNVLYAGNKLSAIKIDVQTGNFGTDEAAFWHKHFPDDPRHNIVQHSLRDYFTIYQESRKYDLSYSSRCKIMTSSRFLEPFRVLDLDVRDIDHRELERIRNLALQGRKVSTLQEYFRTIRAVFDEAVKDGYIEQSPFTRLRKLRKAGDEQDPSELVDPFSRDELTRLLSVCKVEKHRQMMSFLFWTGVRPGEMKALAWEDIDLTAGTARVRYNLNRAGQIKPPKTQAGQRIIELLPEALAVLKRQRELTYMLPAREEVIHLLHNKTRTEQRRRVFLSRENKPYLNPELMPAPGAWANLLRSAKLAHREPYQLRHSYASMMLMIGAHPAYLAKQMGHKDWGMIRKVYAKWVSEENPNYRDELARKLGDLDPHVTPDETGVG